MIFTSTKGGSVVTENPKEGRGSLKTLAGFRAGTTQICMKKGRHGGGGGWGFGKVMKSYWGESLQ